MPGSRGAGNSVAICGLAGGLTVVLVVGAGAPWLAPVVLAYWCGALVGSRWGPGWLLVGVAAAMVALVLVAAMDLHGAAMVAGIVIAAVIGRQVASAGP
jgi:hypothetical protein